MVSSLRITENQIFFFDFQGNGQIISLDLSEVKNIFLDFHGNKKYASLMLTETAPSWPYLTT